MNMDTFKNTALHFNKSPGVVLFHYLYVIQALREMAPNYIQWPSREERAIISQNFYDNTGYEGVVGVIDGMDSFVTAPLDEPQAFFNRHHSYSIRSQVVVDDQMLVRDLYVGEAGSLHDARVFRKSPLCADLLEQPDLMDANQHLLGDGAYILTDKMIVPYDDLGHLNDAQRYHNRILSSCRSIVERAFAVVKGKFPRLKYFRSLTYEYAVDHIFSCFVLHNFIILSSERIPHQYRQPPNRPVPPQPVNIPPEEHCFGNHRNENFEPDHSLLFQARLDGVEKRERLSARLMARRG